MATTKTPLQDPDFPKNPPNKYKVPVKKWRRWGSQARAVFNSTFQQMENDQWVFVHREATAASSRHWKVTAWNAAFAAADNVQRCLTAWAKQADG